MRMWIMLQGGNSYDMQVRYQNMILCIEILDAGAVRLKSFRHWFHRRGNHLMSSLSLKVVTFLFFALLRQDTLIIDSSS